MQNSSICVVNPVSDVNKDWSNLPPETCLNIFYHCKVRHGFVCLYNLSNVCKSWRNVALDSSFWYDVDDIDLSVNMIQQLALLGALTETKSLHVHCHTFSDEHSIPSILKLCPKLKLVHISAKVTCSSNFLIDLVTSCPEIEGIMLSESLQLFASDLKYFLNYRGRNLTTISMHNVSMDNTAFVIEIISLYCPNLKTLEFMGSREDSIPIAALESGCPQLTKLRLTVYGFTEVNKSTNVFSDLTEFYFSSFRSYSFHDVEIFHILRTASKLEILSLFDCNISCSILHDLPIDNLQTLELSYCSIDPPDGLFGILNKWKHCLKRLFVQCVYVENGNLAHHVKIFVEGGGGEQLQILELPREISSPTIVTVVKKCPKLRRLLLCDIQCNNRNDIMKWLTNV